MNTSVELLVNRIRRKLRVDGERLVCVRGRDEMLHGPYMVVDERNCVIASGCTPESLAREMGLIKSD